MSTLSWNEIENRARLFSAKWAEGFDEKGESQSFWHGFFDVFGIDPKRQGAFFEYRAKKAGDKQGFMDVFWPGKILVEQKSLGKDLDAAIEQANNYLPNIEDELLPQMVVACDFNRFICLDRVTNERYEFTLDQLHNHVKSFGFLIGRSDIRIAEEDPVNRQAAEAMAALHNVLRDANYDGHDLEVLLVRLVFCLFADDSGIFEHGTFERYLKERTNPDGSDTGPRVKMIFETLDTPEDERQTTLDDEIASLPYINGGLFKDEIRTPNFTSAMRTQLLDAMNLDWAKVSPAIFGSMFQGVMDPEARRNLGAHYTSEKNIFKVIDSLFLDELKEELSKLKPNQKKALNAFHEKLASLKFLDPACGCGNFLVITYRELRKLEHEVIQKLSGDNTQMVLDLQGAIKVNVDQMYGIEIEEFPALIAETALWLTDHQMNMDASKLFGQHFVRLPLTKRANIVNDNALRIDWKEVVDPSELNYIFGNPPFIGQKERSKQQTADLKYAWGANYQGYFDFVTGWYAKSIDFFSDRPHGEFAFVSTNSITQGTPVAGLFRAIFDRGWKIKFAHRTFAWNNDAPKAAKVHCVIIGFSQVVLNPKLFTYETPKSGPVVLDAKSINAYLIDGPMLYIDRRSKPISTQLPPLTRGSQASDWGYLTVTPEQYDEIKQDPIAFRYLRPFVGGVELIQNLKRWCIWMDHVDGSEIDNSPVLRERLSMVRKLRLDSDKKATQDLALTPGSFAERRQPTKNYLAVPNTFSESRLYITASRLTPDVIAGVKLFTAPDPDGFLFSVISTRIFMAWQKTIGGRLKHDPSFSNTLVWNNFPFPEITSVQREAVSNLGKGILSIRNSAQYSSKSLKDLYNPLAMPLELLKAHKSLDECVELLYRKNPFKDDAERVAHLFEMYAELTKGSLN